jgi:hypothetical protein
MFAGPDVLDRKLLPSTVNRSKPSSAGGRGGLAILVTLLLFSVIQISKTVKFRQNLFRHNDTKVKRW